MTDLCERVNGRLMRAVDLISPTPGPEARLTLLCDHAPNVLHLVVCTRCCAWLTCAACFDEHAAAVHPRTPCDACGATVGIPSREAFEPTASTPVGNTMMQGGQVTRSKVLVTFALSGVVCQEDNACKRLLADGYATAAALPAEPGPVGGKIRSVERALAIGAYGELPPAA